MSLGTPLVKENYSGCWSQIFVLQDVTPASGDLAVTVPNGTGGEAFSVAVLSLSALNGFVAPDAKGNNASASSLAVTFDSEANHHNLVFGAAAGNGNANPTTADLGTNLFSDYASYPGVAMTGDYESSPSGDSVTWTRSGSDRFAVCAVLVKEVVPAGTVITLF